MESSRILIWSLTYSTSSPGGVEGAITDIADKLATLGTELHLMTARNDPRAPAVEWVGNVLVHRIGSVRKAAPGQRSFLGALADLVFVTSACGAALRLFRNEHYKAVWAIGIHALWGVALLRAFGMNVPYVVSFPDDDALVRAYGFRRFMPMLFSVRPWLKRATAVQAASSYGAAMISAHVSAAHVVTVPYGIDLSTYSRVYAAEELAAVRAHVGRQEQGASLLVAAPLIEEQGVGDVLDALGHLAPDVTVAIIGSGPFRKQYDTQSAAAGLAGRVTFLGDLDRRTFPIYLHACDALVVPSRTTAIEGPVLAAMTSITPVITTAQGAGTLVHDRTRHPSESPTGWIVDTRDPAKLATTVETVVGQPDAATDILTNARAMVEHDHTRAQAAEALYTRLFIPLLRAI